MLTDPAVADWLAKRSAVELRRYARERGFGPYLTKRLIDTKFGRGSVGFLRLLLTKRRPDARHDPNDKIEAA